jgi:hypothetical protein
MNALRRLVLTFDNGGIQVRTLYHRDGAGPNPGTATRRRAVAQLARGGLERALEAMRPATLRPQLRSQLRSACVRPVLHSAGLVGFVTDR